MVAGSKKEPLEGPRAQPEIAAIARGETPAKAGQFFNVGWHYEYWWGLAPEAAAKKSGVHPRVAAMIGVEAPADGIPAFRDQSVILMRPALLGSRSCDINFFAPLHDALRSNISVRRTLQESEVAAMCADLAAEAKKLT